MTQHIEQAAIPRVIEVRANIANTCGRDLWYPVNEMAILICALRKRKVLVVDDMKTLKEYGFTIYYTGTISKFLDDLGAIRKVQK